MGREKREKAPHALKTKNAFNLPWSRLEGRGTRVEDLFTGDFGVSKTRSNILGVCCQAEDVE